MTKSFWKLRRMNKCEFAASPKKTRAVFSLRMDFRIKKQRRHNGFMMLWEKIAAKLFFNILSCVLKRLWRKLNDFLHTCTLSSGKTLARVSFEIFLYRQLGKIKLLMIIIAD